jgi:hypothetical protein
MSHATQPRPRSRAAIHAASEERQEVRKFWSRAEGYAESNRIAAEIIVADVVKHGGESAGLVQWARRVLQRETEKQAAAA